MLAGLTLKKYWLHIESIGNEMANMALLFTKCKSLILRPYFLLTLPISTDINPDSTLPLLIHIIDS